MPKRTDIESVLVIGAGPIIIGQGCEFDYSGSQACRALREEGYRVVLVNSNPATVMTDPDMADATYVEPLLPSTIATIIEREKPDALLPTMGGQTGLNCAIALYEDGTLERHGVRLIGASPRAINMAEDRQQFRAAMERIGLSMPRSYVISNMEEAHHYRSRIGYPIVLRPSFTLGGSGGGIACNHEEFEQMCERGLSLSPVKQMLLEQPVIGWKEYELEVVRDRADNCIIICSIENIDPMGVHTGDSVTVAPAQTLTDKEYQRMRDASISILREIGVDTGGSNVQFAVNPDDGDMIVIEMNPRVSRSSALASKATGFPIARIATKLAVGYTLDELANDITGGATPASFEPTLDYIVTKMPRFDFEKFPNADDRLTTQMKSVGEAMAMGRSFQESLQKAMCSLEIGMSGLDPLVVGDDELEKIQQELRVPRAHRLWYVADAFRYGLSVDDVYQLSRISPWFLRQIKDLVDEEEQVRREGVDALSGERLRYLKSKGFSDARLAALLGVVEKDIADKRQRADMRSVYKRVDSCAAEFPTATAYLYSTYAEECEAAPVHDRKKILILGGGPNRIGQGIEFDYCCVHAALALREEGFQTIMMNCNPETVSTDYNVSDRLYFEPLTFEHVAAVCERERPDGLIVQYGGQTPLRLANRLAAAGYPIMGTSPASIDLAEDRGRFQELITRLQLRQPSSGTARTTEDALSQVVELGFPLLLRPSYVLGGRAMEIVSTREELRAYMDKMITAGEGLPILLDRFLAEAIEVDVDAVCDGNEVRIGAIMEHIEQAGVHSGDSACCLPPHSLSEKTQQELIKQVLQLAGALKVVGLINVQFAVRGQDVFVLEVNPRASRTIPYVSKATGVSLAKVAARCMAGIPLSEQNLPPERSPSGYSVKEAVFPFAKLPGVDPVLGPEMLSTGEVMGISSDFSGAFYKAQQAVYQQMPESGMAFISVRDADKPAVGAIGRDLIRHGFRLCATRGTAAVLKSAGVACSVVNKVHEGRPHIVDLLKNEEIDFIVNTTEGRQALSDSYLIRRTVLQHRVFYVTTLAGALAAVRALTDRGNVEPVCLQEHHQRQNVGG